CSILAGIGALDLTMATGIVECAVMQLKQITAEEDVAVSFWNTVVEVAASAVVPQIWAACSVVAARRTNRQTTPKPWFPRLRGVVRLPIVVTDMRLDAATLL